MMKRIATGALFALAFSAPAFADTLKEITSKGIKLEPEGQPAITVDFKADGSFTTDTGGTGTWKIDGEKLCWTSPGLAENQCDAYPKDKKSGDTFELQNAVFGKHKVTIK